MCEGRILCGVRQICGYLVKPENILDRVNLYWAFLSWNVTATIKIYALIVVQSPVLINLSSECRHIGLLTVLKRYQMHNDFLVHVEYV